jgi:thymidylate synthase (FAD)
VLGYVNAFQNLFFGKFFKKETMTKTYNEIMNVRLIGYTQPVEDLEEDINDVQELIAFCAKVSNPQLQDDFSRSERLLNYLIKHKHWSPFEMASATMEVSTTRDIARQFLRHRSFSFQEFSQRYANPAEMGDMFVLREARLQDLKNRQNSIEIHDEALQAAWNAKQLKAIEAARKAYNWAIKKGIAKEQARVVLPEGNTISKLYVQGTIRSWIHYIELRSANGTQREHMALAVACAEAITKIFPMIT